ncbi:Acidic amino acid decarboxylase GADL1, partial [Pseudolycoriella hygida]
MSSNNKNKVVLNFDAEAEIVNEPVRDGTPRRYTSKHFIPQRHFQSLPVRSIHEHFLRESFEIILNSAVFNGTDRSSKVLEFKMPEDLEKILDLNLKSNGDSHATLLELMKDTIRYSAKVGHPHFVNQIFSSIDPYALMGHCLTDSLNINPVTFEIAPVFILMEEIVMKEMRRIVGYKNGDGDGIFTPGGSMANGYAISCARCKLQPDAQSKGLSNLPRLVMFVSEQGHYSSKKFASFMGIGTNNVYIIKTDAKGKLRVDHLEKEILRSKSEGACPFLVVATSGTTVLGAFDPLEQIADICKKYDLWMHVDAAWGGGALMSRKHRTLLKGIERSDSVTWNLHKMLAAPQQCSVFLTRHRDILLPCHQNKASYLFQADKFYDLKYDTGDKHVQCSRRADVLKFWFMWRAKGTNGFEKHVNRIFDNAKYFAQEIKNRPNFEILLENPECTNVCF